MLALRCCAVLASPSAPTSRRSTTHVTDAGYVGALPGEEQRLLSDYLHAHQGSARYEVAAQSATQIGSLIVQDARPIVVLTTYSARVFTSRRKLKRLIAAGQVRYAFLNTFCPHRLGGENAACSAPALWIREHGTDVSREAGLPHGKVLWLLPGAQAVSAATAPALQAARGRALARPGASRSTRSSWARAATARCCA